MSEIFCGTSQISQVLYKTLCENTSSLKIYTIQLSSYYDLVPYLKTYLNASEIQRAQKYHFEKDRNQFIICRSLLKFILAQHTGLSISKISIKNDAHKKPYLSSNKNIYFNVSHSRDFAIFAVSNHDVGIDIEYVNENFDFSDIMPSIFNSIEIDAVLNAKLKTHEFFKFWTRKEAIVKATGEGISDYLTKIPALDGFHSVNPNLIDGFKCLHVLSFDLGNDYMVSIALSYQSIGIDRLIINELPKSIAKLLSYTH